MGAGGNYVNFAVLECCQRGCLTQRTDRDFLQQRLLPPPLIVPGQDQGLLRSVPVFNLKRPCPVLIERLVNEPVIKELLIHQRWVNKGGNNESPVNRIVGFFHSDLDRELVTVLFNALYLLPHGSVGYLVFASRRCKDLVGCTYRFNVNGGAIVELCLGVDLEGNSLNAVLGFSLVLCNVISV